MALDELPDRFWAKVRMTHTCWVWTAGTNGTGYGHWKVAGKDVYAHRTAYEAFVGEIPPGLQIDHLCRNRLCVNPAHLEAVTQRENILRGVGATAINARKSHCPHGHEYSSENTILRPGGGRGCRSCHNAWNAAYRSRQVVA